MKLRFERSTCFGGEPSKGDWVENYNFSIPYKMSYFWAEHVRPWFLKWVFK